MKEVFVQKQHFAVYVMNSNKVKSELKSMYISGKNSLNSL